MAWPDSTFYQTAMLESSAPTMQMKMVYKDAAGCEQTAYSNCIEYHVAEESDLVDENVTLYAQEITTSADPAGYALGESFLLTVTLANVGGDIYDVHVSEVNIGPDVLSLNYVAPNTTTTVDGFTIPWVVNEFDVEKGSHTYQYEATYFDADGYECHIYSNLVTINFIDTENEPAIIVTKWADPPADPSCLFYTPGEIVNYHIAVTNIGDVAVTNIEVSDPLLDFYFTISELQPSPYGYWEIILPLLIEQPSDKPTEWTVDNTATAFAPHPTKPGEFLSGSDSCTIFCRQETPSATLVKEVISSPALGTHYVENETIMYKVTLTNTGNVTLLQPVILDPLCMDNASCNDLLPGESESAYFTYTVGHSDLLAGTVANVAKAHAMYGSNGEVITVYSNEVYSPVGEGENPGPVMTKTLCATCEPANGYSFQVGEIVEFTLCLVNNSEFELIQPVFKDVKDSNWLYHTMVNLETGDGAATTFTYVVTEQDCANGGFVNWATADYQLEDASFAQTVSNSVFVPCGDAALSSGSAGECRRTLVAAGDHTFTYKQEYCAEHGAIHTAAASMSVKTAKGMWLEAIDTMYTKWISALALSPEKQAAARAEYRAFTKMVNAIDPDGKSESLALLDLIEQKCTELCYELHAPKDEQRPDTVTANGVLPLTDEAELTNCTCSQESDGFTVGLCATHCGAIKASKTMLDTAAGNELRTFAAYSARKGMLLSTVGMVWNQYDAENAPAALTAIEQYMNCRQTNLELRYGKNSAIVGELMSVAAMDQLRTVCAMTNGK